LAHPVYIHSFIHNTGIGQTDWTGGIGKTLTMIWIRL